MGELKLKENFIFTLNFELNGEKHSLNCENNKVLIGSSELCDIKIKNPGINHFHCVVIKRKSSIVISKLNANSALEVNDEEVDSAYLSTGDSINILGFQINVNSHVSQVRENKKVSPKRSHLRVVDNSAYKNDDFIYVDGEYVPSKMSEGHFKRSTNLFLNKSLINDSSYIPADELAPLDISLGKDPLTSQKTLDVIFTTFGNIISYDSIPFSDINNYFEQLSPEVVSYIGITKNDNLVKIDNNHLYIQELGGLTRSQESDDSISEHNDVIILEKGVNQIFFKIGKQVSPVKTISSDVRNRKQMITMLFTIFAIFAPTLLLTFFEVPEVKEEKEVVIIYKKKPKPKQKLVQKSDDKKDIDKTAKKEAKKVSENKSDNTKTKKVEKVSQAKKAAPKKKSVKASSKAKASKKVAFASSFSKMIGSSSIKSKNFAKNSKSSGSSSGNLTTQRSGSLSTVGGGSSVSGLSTSSQFGSGKGFKSKGAAKRGFDSKFTSKRTVVLGALDPAVIDRILREHMPEFRYCYQQELVRNPKTSGKITTDFTIGSSGRVTKSALKGKFTSAGKGCMSKVLNGIKFPAPKGGGVVRVTKPFTFSANKTSV